MKWLSVLRERTHDPYPVLDLEISNLEGLEELWKSLVLRKFALLFQIETTIAWKTSSMSHGD